MKNYQEHIDSLVVENVNYEDAETAVAFGAMLQVMDGLAFGENKCNVGLIPTASATHNDMCDNGAYYEPSELEPEYYGVFAQGILNRLERHRDGRNIFLVNVLRKPPVDLDWILLSLACHEVRHRLQYHQKAKMKFFKNKKQRTPDHVLQFIINFTHNYFRGLRQKLYTGGARRAIINRYTGDREFDSHVVELLVLSRANGECLPEVANIVGSEAMFIESF